MSSDESPTKLGFLKIGMLACVISSWNSSSMFVSVLFSNHAVTSFLWRWGSVMAAVLGTRLLRWYTWTPKEGQWPALHRPSSTTPEHNTLLPNTKEQMLKVRALLPHVELMLEIRTNKKLSLIFLTDITSSCLWFILSYSLDFFPKAAVWTAWTLVSVSVLVPCNLSLGLSIGMPLFWTCPCLKFLRLAENKDNWTSINLCHCQNSQSMLTSDGQFQIKIDLKALMARNFEKVTVTSRKSELIAILILWK